MVITDPKGEIYRNTSGFPEQQGYDINDFCGKEPGYLYEKLSAELEEEKRFDIDELLDELLSDE